MKALLSPFQQFGTGFGAFLRGISWLKRHPGHLALLFLPMLVSFGLLVGGWNFLSDSREQLIQSIVFDKPVISAEGFLTIIGDYFWLAIYWLAHWLLDLTLLILGIVACLVLSNVLAAPVYELVSVAVEKELSQAQPTELSWKESLLLIKEELKKAVFILTVSMVLVFIPVVNIIVIPVTALLLGWDFYDYPLARRGLSFRERFQVLSKNLVAVMAFGLWLMIPFVQIIILPLAVPGGTMLGLDHMGNTAEAQPEANVAKTKTQTGTKETPT